MREPRCANCEKHQGKHSAGALKCPLPAQKRATFNTIWHPAERWTPKTGNGKVLDQ